MTIYEYGNPDADTVLIQLTGDHELSVLKNEVEEIRKRTSTDFRLIAAKVDDWNYELSPWKAPVSTLIRVDLPAPFSPISAWISPLRRVKSTWERARTPVKFLEISRISNTDQHPVHCSWR